MFSYTCFSLSYLDIAKLVQAKILDTSTVFSTYFDMAFFFILALCVFQLIISIIILGIATVILRKLSKNQNPALDKGHHYLSSDSNANQNSQRDFDTVPSHCEPVTGEMMQKTTETQV